MKILLVTFSRNVNYGGALQEFAAYRYLKSLGNEVKCYDIEHPVVKSNSALVRNGLITGLKIALTKPPTDTKQKPNYGVYAKEALNQLHVTLSDIAHADARRKMIHNYNAFWRRFVEYTTETEGFDAYVSGGDQIWNPLKFTLFEPYYLTFAPKNAKKFSFSTSTGNYHFTVPAYNEKIAAWLKDYAAVSVRETGSVTELRNHCGINASVLPDPTLLLDRADWIDALGITNTKKGGYLLCYPLANHRRVLEIAEREAKRRNLRLKVLTSEGPRGFVEAFLRANYIVTNSFHGTAFAINFGVPYYSVKSLVPERIDSLLARLKLKHRGVATDFSSAVLKFERERARKFIEGALDK